MQLFLLSSVAKMIKWSGQVVDWLAGGSKVKWDTAVRMCPRDRLRPCRRPRAHPVDGNKRKQTTPNCRWDDKLVQLLQEHKQKVMLAHSRGCMKRLNRPCTDRFSPDASQTHDCKIRELPNTKGVGQGVRMKELKPRQRARAKWITSPQIERSSCVRKLVPPAEPKLRGWGGGNEGWGAVEWLG